MMYYVFVQAEGSDPECRFKSDYEEDVLSYVREHCVDTVDLPDWTGTEGEVLAAGNTTEEHGCQIMWAEGRFPDGWKTGVRFAGEYEACLG